MMQKAETFVCDWSVCAQSHCTHTVCKYTKSSLQACFNLVPLYSLIVVEEELMNVAESPLRMGEETGQ